MSAAHGLVVISALSLAGCATVPRDLASPPPFRAVGTEPFWSLVAENGTLAWTSPEEPVALTAPAKARRLAGGWRFEGMLGGAPLVLEVTEGPCSDGMSDTVYPFAARAQRGGRTWAGCARPQAN